MASSSWLRVLVLVTSLKRSRASSLLGASMSMLPYAPMDMRYFRPFSVCSMVCSNPRKCVKECCGGVAFNCFVQKVAI